jgi:hypothetical protein
MIVIITCFLACLAVALAVFAGPSLDDLRRTARSWSAVGVRPAA